MSDPPPVPPEPAGEGPLDKLTDVQLVARVCEGDADAAVELLLVRCGKRLAFDARRFGYDDLLGHLYLHLRGESNDWAPLRTWTGRGSLRSWISMVARNLCIAQKKSDAASLPSNFVDPDLVASEDDTKGDWERAEDFPVRRSQLLRGIRTLPDQDMLLLFWLFFNVPPMVLAELAKLLEITVENARVRKHRAIQRLREILMEGGHDDV